MALGHRLVLVLRAFGVQKPLVRRMWPRRYRRSDVYRKLVALDQRYGLTDALNSRRQQPSREFVTQDVEIPVEHGADFLRFFDATWACARSGCARCG